MREEKTVFLHFSSITAWNNELHLILTVRGDNRHCKHPHMHVCLSLMLAPEYVAENTGSGKSNYCVAMLQLQVCCTWTSFLNCNTLFHVFYLCT